jgi:hypothetical protein
MSNPVADHGPGPTAGAGPRLRSVAIPGEHGGWSLTLEPVLLGLLVAPGPAGVALGVAALMAFLARTPLKLALVDRRRGRWLPRSALAARVAALEIVVLAGAVAVALATAEDPFWWPLAAAAPLFAVELWYDSRSRGRRFVPEMAGAIGMGALAAAIALAGGESDGVAAALWVALGARSIGAIPFVRVQLRRAKHQAHELWWSDGAQVAAVAVALAGWWFGELPIAAIIAIGVMATAELAAVRTAPPAAAMVGAQQVVLGLMVVVTTALAILAP